MISTQTPLPKTLTAKPLVTRYKQANENLIAKIKVLEATATRLRKSRRHLAIACVAMVAIIALGTWLQVNSWGNTKAPYSATVKTTTQEAVVTVPVGTNDKSVAIFSPKETVAPNAKSGDFNSKGFKLSSEKSDNCHWITIDGRVKDSTSEVRFVLLGTDSLGKTRSYAELTKINTVAGQHDRRVGVNSGVFELVDFKTDEVVCRLTIKD